MVSCELTDFKFPMLADVYHPTMEPSAYGGISKSWILDRTIAGNFIRAGAQTKEELVVNIDLTQDSLLIARIKTDLRVANSQEESGLTNIIVTNIRHTDGTLYYSESSGKRKGQGTLFEVATQQPFINPFRKIEHYTVILRRLTNQGVIQ
jgi:hypothetical protein